MSATTMPGFTPAKAMTSAGLSRASRSRSSAVRSGLAMDFSMAGSAARTLDDRVGRDRTSRQLSSRFLMANSLATRAAHYAQREGVAGTTPIASGTHSGDSFHGGPH